MCRITELWSHPNVSCSSTEQEVEISTPNVHKLSSDLRPLMFWMSNATELLNFFQVKVENMEKEWEFEGKGSLETVEITGSRSRTVSN